MIIEGTYNTAVVYTDTLEETAEKQIKELCNQEFTQGSKIRIMPDVHAGAGCTIGTTMTITDAIVPNLVGVDIGCGMETIKLRNKHIELQKLDKLIQQKIPSGFEIRDTPHKYNDEINLSRLRCLKEARLNINRAEKSIGTLGGGNHFIEVGKDEEGYLYLVIHSGSRHLGVEVAGYYQDLAYKTLNGNVKQTQTNIPKALAYVTGGQMEDYLHDMAIVQTFATLNRKAMVNEIVKGMKLKIEDAFTTIHNYIDLDSMILRKGAVSAKQGERLLIPINMRDGSLICTGKGNPEWNNSAPHGAGRLMSRAAARNSFTVSDFKKEMKDIYTTSVGADTLDECPMAYKSMDHILNHIGDTADIVQVMKPIYNFKAGE